MEKNLPTPENWHWAITPEDVKKIKMFDRKTIDRVYFANYDKFKSICMRRFPKWWEDALQEIYLLIPYLNYTNTQKFFWSIFDGIYFALFGRSIRATVSFDMELCYNDKFYTLESLLGYDYDFLHEENEREELIKVLSLIDNQKSLSDDQKDYLLAVSLGCKSIKGMFNYAKNRFFVA